MQEAPHEWVSASTVKDMDWHAVIVIALMGLVAVFGGGFAVKGVFRFVDRSEHAGPVPLPSSSEPPGAEPKLPDAPEKDASRSIEAAGAVLRGGTWIGLLERIAVFAALLGGWKDAIAIVLAVKALGRYPELRNENTSSVAERFIIGTFVSVLWACAWAGIAFWLKKGL